MVKKKFMFLFLIVGLIPFITASLGTGIIGEIGVDLNADPLDIALGGNYSINVNHSTFSDFWNTDIGILGTVNATQFENNGGILTLDETWVNSLWCQLTGCIMSGNVSAPWFNGRFNWTSGDTWNIFDGNTLTRNDTRYEKTYYNRSEVDELVGGINIDLIFHNSSSGISTYWDMNRTDSRPKNSTATTITTDEQYLGGFISLNASDMEITTIASGLAVGHFHAKVNTITGIKLMSGFFRFYIYHANTTEVLISTSELIPVRSLVENSFEAHSIILNDISLNESDRILVKMYSNFSGGGGGNPILTTYIGGDTASRIEIGTTGVNFATQTDLLDFFRHDGTKIMTGDANWGGKNISNINWASGEVGNFTSLIVGNANIEDTYVPFTGSPYDVDLGVKGLNAYNISIADGYIEVVRKTAFPFWTENYTLQQGFFNTNSYILRMLYEYNNTSGENVTSLENVLSIHIPDDDFPDGIIKFSQNYTEFNNLFVHHNFGSPVNYPHYGYIQSGKNDDKYLVFKGSIISHDEEDKIEFFALQGSEDSAYINISTDVLMRKNLNVTENLTVTNYGFFGWLGSIANRITKIWATDIDVSGTLNVTGTIYSNQTCYTQDCSAKIYHNGTGLIITS